MNTDDWNFWNNGLGDTVYVSEKPAIVLLDHRGQPMIIKKQNPVGFDLKRKSDV